MTRESNRGVSREKKNFYNNYKDITFDTLKERHDNFSIDKVIQTKNQVYNTLHFQGIQKRPNDPKLILFMKQPKANQVTGISKDFSTSKIQNMSENVSFNDNFTKRMQRDSNRPSIAAQLGMGKPRQGSSVSGSQAFELPGMNQKIRREKTQAVDDAYRVLPVSTKDTFDKVSTKGFNSTKQSRHNVFGQIDHSGIQMANSINFSTQQKTEDELWKEFH